MAAEAAHSLADNANDLSLFIAQRRSRRPPDDQHPLGYGREAYFWALIAALGVFVAGYGSSPGSTSTTACVAPRSSRWYTASSRA
jgi:divalent metal cation (Fe/Co/Zn/Cd) transporter